MNKLESLLYKVCIYELYDIPILLVYMGHKLFFREALENLINYFTSFRPLSDYSIEQLMSSNNVYNPHLFDDSPYIH